VVLAQSVCGMGRVAKQQDQPLCIQLRSIACSRLSPERHTSAQECGRALCRRILQINSDIRTRSTSIRKCGKSNKRHKGQLARTIRGSHTSFPSACATGRPPILNSQQRCSDRAKEQGSCSVQQFRASQLHARTSSATVGESRTGAGAGNACQASRSAHLRDHCSQPPARGGENKNSGGAQINLRELWVYICLSTDDLRGIGNR
jgi:hypothetical protein